jgi:hypothetical protein
MPRGFLFSGVSVTAMWFAIAPRIENAPIDFINFFILESI